MPAAAADTVDDYLHNLAPNTFPLLTNVTAAAVAAAATKGNGGAAATVSDALKDILTGGNGGGGGGKRSSILSTAEYVRAASFDMLRCHDRRIPSILRDLYKNALRDKNRRACVEMSAVFNLYIRSYTRLNFYKDAIQLGTGMMASTTSKFVPLDRGVRSVSITMNDVFNDMQWNDVSIERVAAQTCESPYWRLFRSIFLEALMEYIGRDSKLFKDEPDCEPTDTEIVNSYIDVFMQKTAADDEEEEAAVAATTEERKTRKETPSVATVHRSFPSAADDDYSDEKIDDEVATVVQRRSSSSCSFEEMNDEVAGTDYDDVAAVTPLTQKTTDDAAAEETTTTNIVSFPLAAAAVDMGTVESNHDLDDGTEATTNDDIDDFMRRIEKMSTDEEEQLSTSPALPAPDSEMTAATTTSDVAAVTSTRKRRRKRANGDSRDGSGRGEGRRKKCRLDDDNIADCPRLDTLINSSDNYDYNDDEYVVKSW